MGGRSSGPGARAQPTRRASQPPGGGAQPVRPGSEPTGTGAHRLCVTSDSPGRGAQRLLTTSDQAGTHPQRLRATSGLPGTRPHRLRTTSEPPGSHPQRLRTTSDSSGTRPHPAVDDFQPTWNPSTAGVEPLFQGMLWGSSSAILPLHATPLRPGIRLLPAGTPGAASPGGPGGAVRGVPGRCRGVGLPAREPGLRLLPGGSAPGVPVATAGPRPALRRLPSRAPRPLAGRPARRRPPRSETLSRTHALRQNDNVPDWED